VSVVPKPSAVSGSKRDGAHDNEDASERQRKKRLERCCPGEACAELVGELGCERRRVTQVGVRVTAEVVGELGDDPLPAGASDTGESQLGS
jgi:hypothetical protein